MKIIKAFLELAKGKDWREEYLAQSTDLADLEQRMKAVEREQDQQRQIRRSSHTF